MSRKPAQLGPPLTPASADRESYLADTLAVRLGGRAAERLVCGEASTGAADDLASATALATQMITYYGLSRTLGPVSYSDPAATPAAPTTQRGWSERTQQLIDEEVAALLASAESRARELLERHEEALRQLTIALLDQETVSGEQVRDLVQAADLAQGHPAGTVPAAPSGGGPGY